jgi:hypothetical protein
MDFAQLPLIRPCADTGRRFALLQQFTVYANLGYQEMAKWTDISDLD